MIVFVQKATRMFEVDFREIYVKYKLCRKWDLLEKCRNQIYVIDEIQKDIAYLHNKE